MKSALFFILHIFNVLTQSSRKEEPGVCDAVDFPLCVSRNADTSNTPPRSLSLLVKYSQLRIDMDNRVRGDNE